jgi:hypothetical protein
MREFRRAGRTVAVLLISISGLTCRDAAAPTGTGRVAPTSAALALVAALPEDTGDPVIPIRQARVRLFRLPGEIPELAVLDTVVPFLETDADLELTLGIELTMASERFGIELTLLDDTGQLAYVARDTVIAFTDEAPPTPTTLRFRYAGPDTVVARVVLAPRDTVLLVGDAVQLRPTALLSDGGTTSARFGFAVHGTSSVTVDRAGMLRASDAVAPGAAWIIARIVTGLADSTLVTVLPAGVARVVPSTDAIVLTVGQSATLSATARDARDEPVSGASVVWSIDDASVASATPGAAGDVTVVGLLPGSTTARVRIDTVETIVAVRVIPSTNITIVRTSTELTKYHEIATFVATIDQNGTTLPNAEPQWQVSGAATLLDIKGRTVRVLLQAGRAATLSASYLDGSASIALVGAGAGAPTAP